MSCYHPVKAFRTPTGVVFSELARHDILGRIDLPCGMCIGCRMRKASDWQARLMHEAQSHDKSCVVALTYADEHLPAGGSLEHRHFQLFMKRLRKQCGPVRFFMCGEYGPLNLRPHYHAVLFSVDFREDWITAGKSAAGAVFYKSATLERLWGLGHCSVQPLVRETAGYVARYIMKKQLGPQAVAAYDGRKPEYAVMSKKPGIGFEFFRKFGMTDVYPQDFVVGDGTKMRTPRYYDKLLKRADRDMLERVQWKREERGREHIADNTDERLAVREIVHEARMREHKRSL